MSRTNWDKLTSDLNGMTPKRFEDRVKQVVSVVIVLGVLALIVRHYIN